MQGAGQTIGPVRVLIDGVLRNGYLLWNLTAQTTTEMRG